MLVGIAEDIEQLVESHESITRSLIQVHLPKMSITELADIVDKGLTYLEMTIENDTKNNIISFSEEFPQYTHLISKYAAISAINRRSENITLYDFESAVQKAIEQTAVTIKIAYQKATANGKDTIYEKVLIASAITQADSYNCFTNKDIIYTLTDKMNDKSLKTTYLQYLKDRK